MSYYISHMIGIRTGGVFSGSVDEDDLRRRVCELAVRIESEPNEDGSNEHVPISKDFANCPQISHELEAGKGSYVVIAGVFNYWSFERAGRFAARLSEEFGTDVMHMGWDEERDVATCQVYLDGKPLLEVNESPLGSILRRVC